VALGRRGPGEGQDAEGRFASAWPRAWTRAPGVARRRALQSAVGHNRPVNARLTAFFSKTFDLGDIFSKYESCSVKCPLQLLQRVIGVLMIGLIGNVSRISVFARLKTLFIWPSSEFLSLKTSKFEMLPIREVVSVEKLENF
jgi:hypothetical protein